MRRSLYHWFETHRWPGDALIAGAIVLASLFVYSSSPAQLGYSVGAALPLFFRRTYPVPVLIASIFIELGVRIAVRGPLLGSVSALFVIYASVVYPADRRWGWLALGAGLFGAVAAPLAWSGSYSRPVLAGLMALALTLVACAFLAGERRRAGLDYRAAELNALTERTRLLTAERDQRERIAAATERTRIARELHDIVAHSLAVIVVQADGGAAAAGKNPALAEPVLRTIAETSRQALTEMRALVGVLRSASPPSVPDTFAPQPGVADIARLVEQTRGASLAVTLALPEPLPLLPAAVDLTVYRVVQEGLTNVLKHAGPAATAKVEVCLRETGSGFDVLVEVVDDGRGAAVVSDGAGNGIRGMRERLDVHGGSLWTGPRPGGGFRVNALIPLPSVRDNR